MPDIFLNYLEGCTVASVAEDPGCSDDYDDVAPSKIDTASTAMPRSGRRRNVGLHLPTSMAPTAPGYPPAAPPQTRASHCVILGITRRQRQQTLQPIRHHRPSDTPPVDDGVQALGDESYVFAELDAVSAAECQGTTMNTGDADGAVSLFVLFLWSGGRGWRRVG